MGNNITKLALINKQTRSLEVEQPLTEREILASESRLYATGVFDWAEVNPRRQITAQEQEGVIVKVHEAKRNTLNYGFGYEFVSKGGSVPTGTVALPGLPPVVQTLVWAVVVLISLLILWDVFAVIDFDSPGNRLN